MLEVHFVNNFYQGRARQANDIGLRLRRLGHEEHRPGQHAVHDKQLQGGLPLVPQLHPRL